MSNFKFEISKPQGFTLIETLLYLGIAGSIVLAISLFLILLMNARTKNVAILEVQQQGAFVVSSITQAVRNAQSINEPLQGNSGAVLSLNTQNSSTTPSLFSENGGVLSESQGGGVAVALTSPRVSVSNLRFTNLAASGTQGSILISFTLNSNSSSSLASYNYSADFEAAASLRP